MGRTTAPAVSAMPAAARPKVTCLPNATMPHSLPDEGEAREILFLPRGSPRPARSLERRAGRGIHSRPVRRYDARGVSMKRYVAVAGTIGAGKTSLVAWLVKRYGLVPFYEPNEQNPYLADFYADMARWAMHSQCFFLAHKLELHQELAA